jgi:homoserine acetyltransferase
MVQIRNPEVRRDARASASSRGRPDLRRMSEPLSVALPAPFVLYRGGVLHQARIAYECWGKLNAARDNAMLLFTGLSPSAHAAATDNDPAPG